MLRRGFKGVNNRHKSKYCFNLTVSGIDHVINNPINSNNRMRGKDFTIRYKTEQGLGQVLNQGICMRFGNFYSGTTANCFLRAGSEKAFKKYNGNHIIDPYLEVEFCSDTLLGPYKSTYKLKGKIVKV